LCLLLKLSNRFWESAFFMLIQCIQYFRISAQHPRAAKHDMGSFNRCSDHNILFVATSMRAWTIWRVHYRTSIFPRVGRWRSHREIFICMHAALKIKLTPWNSRVDCSVVTLFVIWYYGWSSHVLSIFVIFFEFLVLLQIE